MASKTTVTLFVVLLVAIIVAVDLLFFRNRSQARLIANIGIVLVFVVVFFVLRNR